MSVSVIIPVRDSRQYLNKCIKSVIAQTHTDLEILPVFTRDYPQETVESVQQRTGGSDASDRSVAPKRTLYGP